MSARRPQYSGDELAAMARAHNYYRWIVRQWAPHIQGAVLELGAGTGNFSAHLLRASPGTLTLLEPSDALVAQLQARFATAANVRVEHGVLQDVEQRLAATFDVVVSVNVLEHIDDDVETLRGMHRILRPTGVVLLFVPALPFLFGAMDRAFGHVRRYTKRSLAAALDAAGFSPARVQYVNALGVLPWLVAGRILRRKTIAPASVAFADRTLIPLTAMLERWIAPPLGQSVMTVARKRGP
jgi:SAM-dependent methyltransferase